MIDIAILKHHLLKNAESNMDAADKANGTCRDSANYSHGVARGYLGAIDIIKTLEDIEKSLSND